MRFGNFVLTKRGILVTIPTDDINCIDNNGLFISRLNTCQRNYRLRAITDSFEMDMRKIIPEFEPHLALFQDIMERIRAIDIGPREIFLRLSRRNESQMLVMNYVGKGDSDFVGIQNDNQMFLIERFVEGTGINLDGLPRNVAQYSGAKLVVLIDNGSFRNRRHDLGGERRINENLRNLIGTQPLEADYFDSEYDFKAKLENFLSVDDLQDRNCENYQRYEQLVIKRLRDYFDERHITDSDLKSCIGLGVSDCFDPSLGIDIETVSEAIETSLSYTIPHINAILGPLTPVHYIQSLATAVMFKFLHNDPSIRRIIFNNILQLIRKITTAKFYRPELQPNETFDKWLINQFLLGVPDITPEVVQELINVAETICLIMDNPMTDHVTQIEFMDLSSPERTLEDGIFINELNQFCVPFETFVNRFGSEMHLNSVPLLLDAIAQIQACNTTDNLQIINGCLMEVSDKISVEQQLAVPKIGTVDDLYLTPERISSLHPIYIRLITEQQIKNMQLEVLLEMSQPQVCAFTLEQTQWFNDEQLAALHQIIDIILDNVEQLRAVHFKLMSAEMLGRKPESFAESLSDYQLFVIRKLFGLRPEFKKVLKMRLLTEDERLRLSFEVVCELTFAELKYYTPSQIQLLNLLHQNELRIDDSLQNLLPVQYLILNFEQILSLSHEQINMLQREFSFSTNELLGLEPEELLKQPLIRIVITPSERFNSEQANAIAQMRLIAEPVLNNYLLYKFMNRNQILSFSKDLIKNFTSEDFAAFTNYQMRYFSLQHAQLLIEKIPIMRVAQADVIRTRFGYEDIERINWERISLTNLLLLSPSQVRNMPSNRFNEIEVKMRENAEFHNALSVSGDIANFSPTQLAQQYPIFLRLLSNEQVSQLSPEQTKILGEIHGFSNQELLDMEPDILVNLQEFYFSIMSREQVENLTSEQTSKLSMSQINYLIMKNNLHEPDVNDLKPIQVWILTRDHVCAMTDRQREVWREKLGFTDAEIQQMTPGNFTKLPLIRLAMLTLNQVFEIMSEGQLESLRIHQIPDISRFDSSAIENLLPIYLALLSGGQVRNLTFAQITKLSDEKIKYLMNKHNIEICRADSIENACALQILMLPYEEARSLRINQVAVLKQKYEIQVSDDEVFDNLKPIQILSLSFEQVYSKNLEDLRSLYSLTDGELRNIIPNDFANVSPIYIYFITKGQILNILTREQCTVLSGIRTFSEILRLTPEQIRNCNVSNFLFCDAEHIQALSIEQVQVFQPEWIHFFVDNLNLSVSDTQLERPNTLSSIQKMSLSWEQLNKISLSNEKACFRADIQIDISHLPTLHPFEIWHMNWEQVLSLSDEQIRLLNIHGFSTEELQAMSNFEFCALEPIYYRILMPDELSNISSQKLFELRERFSQENPEILNTLSNEWLPIEFMLLKSEQILGFELDFARSLNYEQLAAIALALPKVSDAQLQDSFLELAPIQILTLDVSQILNIPQDLIQRLGYEFDFSSITTPEQICRMPAIYFRLLTDENVGDFPKEFWQAASTRFQINPQDLTEAQIPQLQSFMFMFFNRDYVQNLSMPQLLAFDTKWIPVFFDKFDITINEEQIATSEALMTLSPIQILALHNLKLSIRTLRVYFNRLGVSLLDDRAIRNLTKERIRNWVPTMFLMLSLSQLRSLNANQVRGLSGEQINLLKQLHPSFNVPRLVATQIDSLYAIEIVSLDIDQVWDVLKNAPRNIIDRLQREYGGTKISKMSNDELKVLPAIYIYFANENEIFTLSPQQCRVLRSRLKINVRNLDEVKLYENEPRNFPFIDIEDINSLEIEDENTLKRIFKRCPLEQAKTIRLFQKINAVSNLLRRFLLRAFEMQINIPDIIQKRIYRDDEIGDYTPIQILSLDWNNLHAIAYRVIKNLCRQYILPDYTITKMAPEELQSLPIFLIRFMPCRQILDMSAGQIDALIFGIRDLLPEGVGSIYKAIHKSIGLEVRIKVEPKDPKAPETPEQTVEQILTAINTNPEKLEEIEKTVNEINSTWLEICPLILLISNANTLKSLSPENLRWLSKEDIEYAANKKNAVASWEEIEACTSENLTWAREERKISNVNYCFPAIQMFELEIWEIPYSPYAELKYTLDEWELVEPKEILTMPWIYFYFMYEGQIIKKFTKAHCDALRTRKMSSVRKFWNWLTRIEKYEQITKSSKSVVEKDGLNALIGRFNNILLPDKSEIENLSVQEIIETFPEPECRDFIIKIHNLEPSKDILRNRLNRLVPFQILTLTIDQVFRYIPNNWGLRERYKLPDKEWAQMPPETIKTRPAIFIRFLEPWQILDLRVEQFRAIREKFVLYEDYPLEIKQKDAAFYLFFTPENIMQLNAAQLQLFTAGGIDCFQWIRFFIENLNLAVSNEQLDMIFTPIQAMSLSMQQIFDIEKRNPGALEYLREQFTSSDHQIAKLFQNPNLTPHIFFRFLTDRQIQNLTQQQCNILNRIMPLQICDDSVEQIRSYQTFLYPFFNPRDIIALDFEKIEVFSTPWLKFFAKIHELRIADADLRSPKVLRLAPIQLILLEPQQAFRIDETAVERLRSRYSDINLQSRDMATIPAIFVRLLTENQITNLTEIQLTDLRARFIFDEVNRLLPQLYQRMQEANAMNQHLINVDEISL